MQDKRVWLIGGAAVASLIAAIGWFGLINPQLSSASSLRGDADSVQQDNWGLQTKINRLQRESAQLDTLVASLKNALAGLPTDSGLPDFTRQVSADAIQSRVALTSITVGSISVYTGSRSTSSSATTKASGDGAGKLFAIPVTLISSGPADHQLDFLRAIQVSGPRRALVGSTQFAVDTSAEAEAIDGASTMTTQLTVFSSPLTPKQAAQLQKLLSGDITN